eukprot:m.8188 g.8188  ORF g.8188 m.8188 type:complete len:914 (-) comp5332_c0_seq1:95-2836(-)
MATFRYLLLHFLCPVSLFSCADLFDSTEAKSPTDRPGMAAVSDQQQEMDPVDVRAITEQTAQTALTETAQTSPWAQRALVVVDLQVDFERIGAHYEAILPSIAALVREARAHNRPIVWIRSDYRADMRAPAPCPQDQIPPNDVPQLYMSHFSKKLLLCIPGTEGYEFHPAVQELMKATDHVVTKTWFDGFHATNLQTVLEARQVKELVVCGVTTNNCVTATATRAIRLGYAVAVPQDACTFVSPHKHRKGLDVMAGEGCTVLSTADLLPQGSPFTYEFTERGFPELAGCYITLNLSLPSFEEVDDEVSWQTMHHRGGPVPRLVSVQGAIKRADFQRWWPLYRHPAEDSPDPVAFTPAIKRIQQEAASQANHALIQKYRDGSDFIAEHADKTLDIVPNSHILNVSLGAQRTLTLTPKRQLTTRVKEEGGGALPTFKLTLANRSVFGLSFQANQRYLHAIKRDMRPLVQKTDLEVGARISLTFRQIHTWQREVDRAITAVEPTRDNIQTVVQPALVSPAGVDRFQEGKTMLHEFGRENQDPWFPGYSSRFLTVEVPRPKPLLYIVNGSIPSWRVRFLMKRLGFQHRAIRLRIMGKVRYTRLPYFQSINAEGKTPTLVMPGGQVITESGDIMRFVQEVAFAAATHVKKGGPTATDADGDDVTIDVCATTGNDSAEGVESVGDITPENSVPKRVALKGIDIDAIVGKVMTAPRRAEISSPMLDCLDTLRCKYIDGLEELFHRPSPEEAERISSEVYDEFVSFLSTVERVILESWGPEVTNRSPHQLQQQGGGHGMEALVSLCEIELCTLISTLGYLVRRGFENELKEKALIWQWWCCFAHDPLFLAACPDSWVAEDGSLVAATKRTLRHKVMGVRERLGLTRAQSVRKGPTEVAASAEKPFRSELLASSSSEDECEE